MPSATPNPEPDTATLAADPDFRLRWHPQLLLVEARQLEGRFGRSSSQWANAWELLLTEAFEGAIPAERFTRLHIGGGVGAAIFGAAPTLHTQAEQHRFASAIMTVALSFQEPGSLRALWSERTMASTAVRVPPSPSWARRQIVERVRDLERRGYFVPVTGEDCVDSHEEVAPLQDVVASRMRRSLNWDAGHPDGWSDADFFDAIEVLHQLVQRPATQSYHSYSSCGWHHTNFSCASGQRVFRYFINRVLDTSEVPFRVATSGADVGCMTRRGSAEHQVAVERVLVRGPQAERDAREHTIQLYRSRGSTLEDRRSATNTLARLLEARKELIKETLTKRGADPLFEMLNRWDVRHNREDQIRDYDPAFLDWLFLNCLSTLDLFDALEDREP